MTFKVYEPDEDLNTKIFLSSAKYIKFENGQIIFSDMADEDILNIMTMISNYNFLLLYLGLSDEKKKQLDSYFKPLRAEQEKKHKPADEGTTKKKK